MARRNECYVDTSALIAFLDRSDSYHGVFKRLFAKPPELITSALVVAEGHGWFLRRYDVRRALQYLAFLEALPGMTIERFDGEELGEAAWFVKKFADQGLTLSDAHGLAIMKRRKVGTCWSTDRHLALGGARLVI